MDPPDEETKWDAIQRHLETYLSSSASVSKLEDMIANQITRYPLNLDDLRKQFNPSLVRDILSSPLKAIQISQPFLQKMISDLRFGKKNLSNLIDKGPMTRITFEGNLGRNLVTPRGLNASLVNNLVGVQGIVTRISLVRPKLVKSLQYCEATKVFTPREYNDDYELGVEKNLNITNAFALKDNAGNPLTCEFGLSIFRDLQTIVLQEMPEKAPTGLLPRSIEVVFEEDLVDKVKPGDRVQIIGVYRALPTNQTKLNGYFKVVLVATSVSLLNSDVKEPPIVGEDIKNIRKIAESEDIFDLLGRSIAPSIQGHDYIKKGILLMLLGGVEKTLENNTHLRGDINILIIGDPSTAKSQLLRQVLSIAPLAINTTGRGSSGVGLTAAVSMDKETGEKHLEAGAMVLADRGVVCIDEFDKMNEVDRVAIHEVMEQQTVTIAKAGIHASLNARCSVIAAANPIYGEYQRDLPPTKNIGLPDSLLSRFDLLFVVLDEKNSMHDRKVAERVTRNHRYLNPNSNENYGFLINDENYVIEPEIADEKNDPTFEKFNNVLHIKGQKKILSRSFLKKYIFFAKKSYNPVLEDEAIEMIAEAWNKLRQKDFENSNFGLKNLPITIRTLETLIRLASAHAKMRLSKRVLAQDSKAAIDLLNFALFNELPEENMAIEKGEEDAENAKEVKSPEKEGIVLRKLRDSGRKQQPALQIKKLEDPPVEKSPARTISQKMKKVKLDEEEDVKKTIEDNILGSISVSETQVKTVFKIISTLFAERRNDSATLEELMTYIKVKNHPILTQEELMKCLVKLDDRSKIMYERKSNTVFSLH